MEVASDGFISKQRKNLEGNLRTVHLSRTKDLWQMTDGLSDSVW